MYICKIKYPTKSYKYDVETKFCRNKIKFNICNMYIIITK